MHKWKRIYNYIFKMQYNVNILFTMVKSIMLWEEIPFIDIGKINTTANLGTCKHAVTAGTCITVYFFALPVRNVYFNLITTFANFIFTRLPSWSIKNRSYGNVWNLSVLNIHLTEYFRSISMYDLIPSKSFFLKCFCYILKSRKDYINFITKF
jgi:hypothetical protein